MKQERLPSSIDLFCKWDLEVDAAAKTKKRTPSGFYKKMDEIHKNWKARNKMNNDLDRINEAMNKIPKDKKWKVFFPEEYHKHCVAALHRFIAENKFAQVVSVIPKWERTKTGRIPFYVLHGASHNNHEILKFVHSLGGTMVALSYCAVESAKQTAKKPLLQFTFKKVVQEKTGTKGYVISGFVGKLYDKANLPLEYIQSGTPHFYKQGGNLWISGLADNDLSMIRYDAYHKMHEISISPHELCQSNFIKKEEFPKFLDTLKAAGERLTRINREIRNKKRTWKGSGTVAI